MHLALEEAARAAERGEVPVGAVIVRGDTVLARAGNLREGSSDPTAHAELLALRLAAQALGTWRLDGCRVYVTLEPCAMCAGAMVLSRIATCIFGCADPKGGFLGSLGDLSRWPGLNHRYAVVSGVLDSECAAQLREFFRRVRATEN
jgi:tRNA(adenine34) deaminase